MQRNESVVGRVVEILTRTPDEKRGEHDAIVILETFTIAHQRHPLWNMPYLYRPSGEHLYFIIHAKVIH